MLHDVTTYSVRATVFECDVSKANGEAPVEFWKKKIEEAVRDDLGWSGEKQLAEEGESGEGAPVSVRN